MFRDRLFLFFSLFILGLSAPIAGAQTLAEVLSSLQERHLLIEQRETLKLLVRDVADAGEAETGYLGPEMISWDGVSSSFPTESDINSLSIHEAVSLLNQAAKEFDQIKRFFVNMSSKQIAQAVANPDVGMAQGQLFTEHDLPSIGLVTPGNYRAKLQILAIQINALKVVSWPVVEYAVIREGLKMGQGDAPETINLSDSDEIIEIEQEASSNSDGSWSNQGIVYGYDEPTPDDSGPDDIDYSVTAEWNAVTSIGFYQQIPNWTDLVNVTGHLLHRRRYNSATEIEVGDSGLDDDDERVFAARFNSDTALIFGQEGDYSLYENLPNFKVTGSYYEVQEATPNTVSRAEFLPNGMLFGDLEKYNENDKNINYSPLFYTKISTIGFGWIVYEREYQVIAIPSFSRGFNAAGRSFDEVLLAQPAPPVDSTLVPFSNPGLIFSIGLGKGVFGSGYARLGVVHPKHSLRQLSPQEVLDDENISEWRNNTGIEDEKAHPGSAIVAQHPTDWIGLDAGYPAMASDIRVLGAKEHFQIIYEGVRAPAPEWGGEETWEKYRDLWARAFLNAWERPRIKQVVGHSVIANFEYGEGSRFNTTIRLYRRQPGDVAGGGIDPVPVTVAPYESYTLSPEGNLINGVPSRYYDLNVGGGGRSWEFRVPPSGEQFNLNDYIATIKKGGINKGSRRVISDDDEREISIIDMDGSVQTSAVTICKQNTSYVDHPLFGDEPVPENVSTNVLEADFPASSFEIGGGVQSLRQMYSPDARFPASLTIVNPVGPDSNYTWNDGIPVLEQNGAWSISYSEAGSALLAKHQLSGQIYAQTWISWAEGGAVETVWSAPDGTILSQVDPRVARTTTSYYSGSTELGSEGLPWAPRLIVGPDGIGSSYTYNLSGNGQDLTTTIHIGVVSGESVAPSRKYIEEVNANAMPVCQESFDRDLKVGETSFSSFNAWGAPHSASHYLGSLTSAFAYDSQVPLLSSVTDVLGVETSITERDAFHRPTAYRWKGHDGQLAYNESGLGFSNELSITNVGGRGSSQRWDQFGNLLSATYKGQQETQIQVTPVGDNRSVQISNVETTATSTIDILGSNGAVTKVEGNTSLTQMSSGSGIAVVNGLLTTTVSLAAQSDSFKTEQRDAWGRICKVTTPNTAGSGGEDMIYQYSNPGNRIKRTTMTDAAGRISIVEIDEYHQGGRKMRQGVDVDGNGSLGPGDRYIEAVSTIFEGQLNTAISKSIEPTGLRTILEIKSDPSTGARSLVLNNGEETITQTPNFASRVITVTSSKGWSRTDTMTEDWQLDLSEYGGIGVPTIKIDPSLREDGSLQGIMQQYGGASSSVSFNEDGSLKSIIDPVRGALATEHSWVGGVETLSVDGTTVTRKFDGTESSITGQDVYERSVEIEPSLNGFSEEIKPVVGESTTRHYNASGAKSKHDYAVGADNNLMWKKGGELESLSLGRGGVVTFGYSGDGARDLASVTYPAIDSSSSLTEVFTYGLGGNLKTISDRAGLRELKWAKDRLDLETYLAGGGALLAGYKVDRVYDPDSGRQTGVKVIFNDSVVHEVSFLYNNGSSNELTGVNSGGMAASYQRNMSSRRHTGVTRNGVVQSWPRNSSKAGRILGAGSNVASAPSFEYASFDTKGRRQRVNTNKGSLTYHYDPSSQLTSAAGGLGSFTYNVDGIGRRDHYQSQPGTPQHNQAARQLNQPSNINLTQELELLIEANPDARLWVNDVEIINPGIPFLHQIPVAGFPEGGWVSWKVLGVVEGAGEPGAGPDARAIRNGIKWVNPAGGSYEHDDDGNRTAAPGWVYLWDGRNRMIGAETKDFDLLDDGVKLTFDYDAQGRRISKKVTTKSGGNLETKSTHFVWHGWDLLYECQKDSNEQIILERKYAWGLDISGTRGGAGGAGGLLVIHETIGGVTKDYYPLYDGTGHIVGLSDATENLIAEYWHGPYGEPLEIDGPQAQSNPWRYATKYFDVETGLYYFGHRYLDPVTGNWLSREPLGEDESLNLYAYCHGDPINKVDVLGLASVVVGDQGRFFPSTQSASEHSQLLLGYEWEDLTNQLIAESAEEQVFQVRLSHVETLFRARLNSNSPTQYYSGNNIHGWNNDIFNAAEGARLAGADPNLVFLIAQQAQRDLTTGLADVVAQRRRENQWNSSFVGASFNAIDSLGQVMLQAPGALEYFGREVTGFNSFTRLMGGDWGPGFGSFSEVGAGGRAFAIVELGLLATPLRGRFAGSTPTTRNWGAGGFGYTLNRHDLARKSEIFRRARVRGILVDNSLGAGQHAGILGNRVNMNVGRLSTSTVAIEEYLHARFTQRLIKRYGIDKARRLLPDDAFRWSEEVRLKSKLIGAGERGFMGGSTMTIDLNWLRKTRGEYLKLLGQ